LQAMMRVREALRKQQHNDLGTCLQGRPQQSFLAVSVVFTVMQFVRKRHPWPSLGRLDAP
jgi:hypothetical protein